MEKKYLSRDKIVGRQVIDSEGVIIGTVKDVTFDLKAKEIALNVVTKTGSEMSIQGADISTIGEVVLLSKPVEIPAPPTVAPPTPATKPSLPPAPVQTPPSAPAQPRPPGLCPACSYQNDPNSRFCIKCGTKLRP